MSDPRNSSKSATAAAGGSHSDASGATSAAPGRAPRRRALGCVFGIVLAAMIVGGVFLAWRIAEGAAGAMIASTPDYPKARLILAGRIPRGEAFFALSGQNVIAQPFLQYIPAPYPDHVQGGHNPQGYRGEPVPLARTPGVARVLFLGGSTTYGWSVHRWEDAYPARLRELMRARLPAGIRDVEVINAGLPAGTTAENVTHYHFKFHYYRPDIVVLEAGGNDADPHARAHYHPDFSHFRPTLANLQPMPEKYRWAMDSSNILALFLLRCMNVDFFRDQSVAAGKGEPPLAKWFTHADGTTWGENEPIPDEGMAFLHNLDGLVRMVMADGALMMLTPFRASPRPEHAGHYPPEVRAYFDRFAREMEAVAAREGLGYAPFPVETVASEDWADPCHLNEEGERKKAEHLAPVLAELMARLDPARVGVVATPAP